MSQLNHARVIRAYTLPVQAFDHLKIYQRVYQNQVNLTGDGRTVTNSEALCNIIQDHACISLGLMFSDLSIRDFGYALSMGDLIVSKPGGQHVADL